MDLETTPETIPVTRSFSNVVFIDQNVSDYKLFLNNINDVSFPIVYHSSTTREEILSQLVDFSHLDRIAFVFHGIYPGYYYDKPFLENQPYFTLDGSGNVAVTENVSFIQSLLSTFTVSHVDFLGCKLLLSKEWRNYFDLLGCIVGASNDNTGNLKYGGDWILENTMEDVQNVYFTSGLDSYSGLLDTYVYNDAGTNRTYTYTVSTNQAQITNVSPSTGTIIVPRILNTYTVISFSSSSKSMTLITLPSTLTSFPLLNGTPLVRVNLSNLTNININVQGAAMNSSSALTNVILPNISGLLFNGSGFYACSALRTITFPPSCTIYNNMFDVCTSLKRIVLPSNVVFGYSFSNYAFPSSAWTSSTISNIEFLIYNVMTNDYSKLNSPSTLIGTSFPTNPPTTLIYKVPLLPTISGSTYNITTTFDTTGTTLTTTYTTEDGMLYTSEVIKNFIIQFASSLNDKILTISRSVLLPGFTDTGYVTQSNTYIYNASIGVQINYVNSITSSTLLNTSFYVLLDFSGDLVTLYTTNNTAVTITKTNSTTYRVNYNSITLTTTTFSSFSFENLFFRFGKGGLYGTCYIPPPYAVSNTYFYTFYTYSATKPTVLTRSIYNNNKVLQSSFDISFGGQNIQTVLSLLDSGSGPYTLGLVNTNGNSVAMDVAFCGLYSKALTTSQAQKLMTYVNTTFKEPRTAAFIYTVTVSGGVFNLNGVARPTITFVSGQLYIFDQSDSSNLGNTLVLGQTPEGLTRYTGSVSTGTNVVYNGTPGTQNAYTLIDYFGI